MGGDFFSFDVVETRRGPVFALRGELDVAHAEELRLALTSVAEGSVVVVDLSELTFIDSSGLTALVHARNKLAATGAVLQVRGARGNVKHVFQIAGLTRLLVAG